MIESRGGEDADGTVNGSPNIFNLIRTLGDSNYVINSFAKIHTMLLVVIQSRS
jgi:hypothetical protein